jgi:hypothetical protein
MLLSRSLASHHCGSRGASGSNTHSNNSAYSAYSAAAYGRGRCETGEWLEVGREGRLSHVFDDPGGHECDATAESCPSLLGSTEGSATTTAPVCVVGGVLGQLMGPYVAIWLPHSVGLYLLAPFAAATLMAACVVQSVYRVGSPYLPLLVSA